MPFTESSIMDQRLCFVAACLRAEEPMTSLCRRYGISRKIGYKWFNRHKELGAAGLADQSRAPHTTPHQIEPDTAERILSLKRRRPTWGPRKLLARLEADFPEDSWPAASTVGELLKRHGLVRSTAKRGHAPPPANPVAPTAVNEVWSADFKGWFRTRDGLRCEPLTISDNYSRFLFTCEAVPRISYDVVGPIFEEVFREHGLPEAIRTDNGSPFAMHSAFAGLTKLSVWLLKLDIRPDRIDMGRPDQNGRHERMHRTLKEDTARPPAETLALQQERFDRWRLDYNTYRPHEALGGRSPAHAHAPSPRPFPERLVPWDYPADHDTQRVDKDGYIKWRCNRIYLAEALSKEAVAITQADDETWIVRFRNFDLATVDERTGKIRCSRPARSGGPGTNPENCYPCSRSDV